MTRNEFVLELNDLAKRIEEGDTNARQEMIEKNLKLVYKIAHSFKDPDEYEDMVSEGYIGLIKAVDKFDWRRGSDFYDFANIWIRKYIYDYLRLKTGVVKIPYYTEEPQAHNLSRNYISIDTSGLGSTSFDALTYEDTVEEDIQLSQVTRILHEQFHKALTDKEAEVFSRKIGMSDQGAETLQGIATSLGISRQSVGSTFKTAKNKVSLLKEEMLKEIHGDQYICSD